MAGPTEREAPDGRAHDLADTARRSKSWTPGSGETADILDYMAHVRRKARNNAESGLPAAQIGQTLFDLSDGAGSTRWALAWEAEAFPRRGRESRRPSSWRVESATSNEGGRLPPP